MTTTNYETMLRPEAERVLKPLADAVALREKELATVRKRLADETERAKGAADTLAALKAEAGGRLAGGGNAFERFKTTLKKRQALLDASREIVRLLTDEIIPQSDRALAEAKAAVQAGFLDFVGVSRPLCEAPMTALIGQALAERDDFMAALDALAADYAVNFRGQNRNYPDPVHVRPDTSPYRAKGMVIITALEEQTTSGDDGRLRRGAYPTPAPPAPETPPAPPEAPQEAQDERGPAEPTQESSPDLGAPETPVNLAPASAADDVAGAAPEPLRDVVGLADAEAEAPPMAEAVPAEPAASPEAAAVVAGEKSAESS